MTYGRRAKASLLFERAVFMFPYKNKELLQQVQNTMYEINGTALPEVSLRSYQLTEDERVAANEGHLDIITGFTVIDDKHRIIVIEGIGGNEGGMGRMAEAVRRSQANDEDTRIYRDSAIRFHERAYTEFDVDLKRIRLRNVLSEIVEKSDIYNIAKVSKECFRALHDLQRLAESTRLRQIKDAYIFPSVKMLLQLESKYGEAISIEDIEGVARKPRRRKMTVEIDEKKEEPVVVEKEEALEKTRRRQKGREIPKHLKGPTDQANPEYERYLRNKPPPEDFLKLQRTLREEAVAKRREEIVARPKVEIPGGGKIYNYSSQSRNFTEITKEAMRKELAKDRNATYTYSMDYNSLTMCMVNEDEIELQAKLDSRAKFTTKSGFVYPATKDEEELRHSRVPKDVSQARKDDLAAKWVEGLYSGKALGRDIELPPGQKDFDTVPSNGKLVFGGYHADGAKNPAFFTSVHLGGDEQAALEKE